MKVGRRRAVKFGSRRYSRPARISGSVSGSPSSAIPYPAKAACRTTRLLFDRKALPISTSTAPSGPVKAQWVLPGPVSWMMQMWFSRSDGCSGAP